MPLMSNVRRRMNEIDALPGGGNFFGSLYTALSKQDVAQLYELRGWRVRKCTSVDFEVRCPWAELVINGEHPILLHGPVADVVTNAERILEPLRRAGVSYSAESYGEQDELLGEYTWSADRGV